MRTAVDDNIEALSRAILSEAQVEVDRVLAEAREKAEAIKRRAQEQAEKERQAILARAREEANRLRGQTIATTQLKARTMQLEHREQLLEKVFMTAEQDLSGIQQWSDYAEIAKELLHEAIVQLGADEVVIRSDPTTQSALTPTYLQKYSNEHNVKVQVGKPLENGLGIVVETANGHLQFDNTFETRLHRMKSDIRAPIYHLLMGESA